MSQLWQTSGVLQPIFFRTLLTVIIIYASSNKMSDYYREERRYKPLNLFFRIGIGMLLGLMLPLLLIVFMKSAISFGLFGK